MKKLLLGCGLLLLSLPVFGQEWGGSLDASATGSNTLGKPYYRLLWDTKVSTWLNFGRGSNLEFAALGGVKLSGSATDGLNQLWPQGVTLDLAKLTWKPLGGLTVLAGRQSFRDLPDLVYNGLGDGLGVRWQLGSLELRAGGLYSGLLLKSQGGLEMSRLDNLFNTAGVVEPLTGQTATPDEKSPAFSAPKVLGWGVLTMDHLLGQSISLGYAYVKDLRSDKFTLKAGSGSLDTNHGSALDAQYATVGLAGELAPGLFYSLDTSGQGLQILNYNEAKTRYE